MWGAIPPKWTLQIGACLVRRSCREQLNPPMTVTFHVIAAYLTLPYLR